MKNHVTIAFKSYRLYLLLALMFLALSGCQQDASEAERTKLFVIEASDAQFVATADEGVYRLTTRQPADTIAWFNDRPYLATGYEPLNQFLKVIWPRYFEAYSPSAALALRTASGDWRLASAQVLALEQDRDSLVLNWTLKMDTTVDFAALDKVLIYLDNEGALLAANESHTFLHAAAQGHFTPLASANDYQLQLHYPLDTLLMLAVTPHYHAQLVTNSLFVDSFWPASFSDAPPNAAVTLQAEDGSLSTAIVTLSQPQWDINSQQLTYHARALSGEVPSFKGAALIFIDAWDEQEDRTIYTVVVNHEEQYSIWPAERELPLGWRSAGFSGQKQACLDYIERVWTDMRPLSLRKKMEEMAKQAR
jgi:MbtH protein